MRSLTPVGEKRQCFPIHNDTWLSSLGGDGMINGLHSWETEGDRLGQTGARVCLQGGGWEEGRGVLSEGDIPRGKHQTKNTSVNLSMDAPALTKPSDSMCK